MRLRTALSIPRDVIMRLQYDGFQQLIRGMMANSKLAGMSNVHLGFTAYLQSLDIHPDDTSVLNWLQENTGDMIGGFILEQDDGRIDFLVTTGTQAELRQIGMQHVTEGSNDHGVARIGKVNVGQKESPRKPRIMEEGKQRRPSYYD